MIYRVTTYRFGWPHDMRPPDIKDAEFARIRDARDFVKGLGKAVDVACIRIVYKDGSGWLVEKMKRNPGGDGLQWLTEEA